MIVIVVGSLCLLVGGAIAMPRARRELGRAGRLSRPTFVATLVAYGGLGICTFLTAWWSLWLLPIPVAVAYGFGSVLAVAGGLLYAEARMRFRSFRLTWGLSTDRLVTGGAYRFSRNPQSVGWLLLLVGVALVGRSAGALLLAALYLLSCLVWLPVEERILEQHFGDRYRRYRETVPRYLGLPREGGNAGMRAA